MNNAPFGFCPLFLKIRQDIDTVNLQCNSRRISTKQVIGNQLKPSVFVCLFEHNYRQIKIKRNFAIYFFMD